MASYLRLHSPRSRSAGFFRVLWKSEAGNALYATMLLIPVGLGIIGAGVDGLYWYQARQALQKSAFQSAQSAYTAYQDGNDMEDAARAILDAQKDRYGEIETLSVSIATDAGRKATDLQVSTQLLLPLTSKLLGLRMTLEVSAASDQDTTASVMAGVEKPVDEVDEPQSEQNDRMSGGGQASPVDSGSASSGNGGRSQSGSQGSLPGAPTKQVITESVDRIDPIIMRKSSPRNRDLAP